MNVFNRILVVLLLVAALLLAVLLAVFPLQVIATGQRGLATAGESLQAIAGSQSVLFIVGRVALVLAAIIIFGLLLLAEVRVPRPKAARVQTREGTFAEVTADSVARRLTWHIDQLADVISVVPQVTPRGRMVDVVLNLQTAPDVDVPMKTEEVVQCAKEIIVERMGLQPGKIQVRIAHAPYQERA